jgi:hypothetical protein
LKTPSELHDAVNLNIERYKFLTTLPDYFTNRERIRESLNAMRGAVCALQQLDNMASLTQPNHSK